MFELIARLRRRPLAARRRIAFITALSFTLIVALMWVLWLTVGGIAIRTGAEEPVGGTPAQGIWSPLRHATEALGKSIFR